MKRLGLLVMSVVFFAGYAFAQNTGTGTPPFGSYSTSPRDTINNQNLNVHVKIPFLSVRGRHTGFYFNQVYDSMIYARVTSGGTTSWTPVLNNNGDPTWGWNTLSPMGEFLYTDTWTYPDDCDSFDTQTNWSFLDGEGTPHPFSTSLYISYYYSCDGVSWYGNYTGYATDNSGYYLNIINGTAQSKDGITTCCNEAVSDPNGNYIWEGGSSAAPNWTDTTGREVIAGSIYSTYTDYEVPGGVVLAAVNYETLSIMTNFGCSDVVDYMGTARVPSSIVFTNGDTYSFTYEPTPSHSGYYTGRLQKIQLPDGGYYEYVYGTTNDGINCSDGTTLNVTREINDGTNTYDWVFNRTYSSGWTTTVTDPGLSYDTSPDYTVYTFNTNGQETSRKVYHYGSGSSATLQQTVNTTWASNGTPDSKMTILDTSSTQAETDTSYDSNGILQSLTEYDWGTGTHGSSSPLRTTTYSYALSSNSNYTSQNLLGLVTTKSIQNSSGTTVFRQDYTYDGVSLSSCPTGVPQHWDYSCSSNYRGNITSISTYLTPAPTPANPITWNFTYDWFGNLLTASNGSTQQIQQVFSSTTNYTTPDSVKLGPSTGTQLTTSYTYYNSTNGLMESSTDPNGLTTSYVYDTSWRPEYITRPDSTVITYSYNDTAHTVTVNTPIASGQSTNQITAKDALGRVSTTTLEDGSDTVYSIVQNQYDALGRLYRTSDPYTSSPGYWTTTQFDALGRAIATVLPDGNTTTYSYSANTVTTMDSAGKVREMKTDAAGRTAAIIEDPSGLDYETDYGYDVLDDLTGVTAGSQSRTYVYDALGRLASATTPEGGTVCFGTYSGSTCQQNGYDNFGNLISRTDNRGVVTSYTYDTLNRLVGISYPTVPSGVSSMPNNICNPVSGTANSNVCFYYDAGGSSAYAYGQLTSMVDPSGSETYTYNNMGRQTELSKVIGSTTFNTYYTYNLGGEVTEITYPSGRNVYQYYDTLGRLCAVGASGASCTTGTTYTNSFTYNAAQQVTAFNYGNGVAASLGYSVDRLQLTGLSYAKSGTPLFGQTYGYTQGSGNNGQITSITDTVNSARSRTFVFDSLGRLETAAASTYATSPTYCFGESYSTDRYGNLTGIGSISSSYTGCTQDNLSVSVSTTTNQITTSGYSYDSSGNMTNDGSNTFVYDGESRATSANSGNAAYTYDGNGVRVKKAVTGGTTTTYLFSGGQVIAEYTGSSPSPSSPSVEYIYSGGQLTAEIAGGTTSYFHQDDLSVRLMTNSSGTDIGDQGHFPYGKLWYPSSEVTKWLYTTYERDGETGNDYAMARSYVNRLGRFNSPDLLAGDVINPQSLNRYAYVKNDPVNRVDPSGLCDDSLGDDDPSCGTGTLPCEPGDCFDPNPCNFIECGSGAPTDYSTPPQPPGEPVGDPSGVGGEYGTWSESLPAGVQVFPPPFGGISFPSSPTGCTYGSGSCGGMIYGLQNGNPSWTDEEGNTVYFPEGFMISALVTEFLTPQAVSPHPPRQSAPRRVQGTSRWIKNQLCGSSWSDAVWLAVRDKALWGLASGAAAGAVTGEIFGVGVGGPFGAILGGITGATIGGTTGIFTGAVSGAVCTMAGAY